jgi:hypothetical protein
MKQQIDLSALTEKWPSAYVARSEIGRFTGGMISPGTVANLDCQGRGPEGRITVGRRAVYPVEALVRWLEARAGNAA